MPDFAPIASELRQRIVAHYAERGERLEGDAGQKTLETNSGLVPRRGEPLARILRERAGHRDLAGVSIADLGCGFGGLSVYFAHLGAEVKGLDLNQARLAVPTAVCTTRGLPASFERAPMQSLPLADGSVDVAIMNNSLCYLVERRERQAALGEALRALRPGGHLLIRNPNRWALSDPFTSLPLLAALPGQWPGRIATRVGRPRSDVALVSVPAARRELLKAGFAAVDEVAGPGRRRPFAVRLVSRYQHLLARKAHV